MLEQYGAQPGDPQRGARVALAAIAQQPPPRRLVLGSGGFDAPSERWNRTWPISPCTRPSRVVPIARLTCVRRPRREHYVLKLATTVLGRDDEWDIVERRIHA